MQNQHTLTMINDTENTYRFDSLSQLAQHVRALPSVGAFDDIKWQGGTWDQVWDLISVGWHEAAREAADMATRIADRVVEGHGATEDLRIGYDVSGAAFDMGSVMAGVPEAWATFEPFETHHAIRIVVDVAVSMGVSTRIIKRRGIALAALAIALTSRGHPVTIDVIEAGQTGRNSSLVTTRIADANSGSPLDIDRLVYATAHPSFPRMLCRSTVNQGRDARSGSTWGTMRPYRAQQSRKVAGECDLFLGAGHLDDVKRWKDGGEAWVISEFEKQTQP